MFKAVGSRFYDFSCYIAWDDDEIACGPTGLDAPPVLPTYFDVGECAGCGAEGLLYWSLTGYLSARGR